MSLPRWLTKFLYCTKCEHYEYFFMTAFEDGPNYLICEVCHSRYDSSLKDESSY